MSIAVEVDLKEILGQINQKLDDIQRDVTDIKLELTEVKGDVKRLDENIDSDVKVLVVQLNCLDQLGILKIANFNLQQISSKPTTRLHELILSSIGFDGLHR